MTGRLPSRRLAVAEEIDGRVEQRDVKYDTTTRMADEAAYRHMTVTELSTTILDTIADDDLFAAVLGDKDT